MTKATKPTRKSAPASEDAGEAIADVTSLEGAPVEVAELPAESKSDDEQPGSGEQRIEATNEARDQAPAADVAAPPPAPPSDASSDGARAGFFGTLKRFWWDEPL